MIDVIIDTLIDAAKLFPFLFLTYLAMEFLESRTGEKTKHIVKKAGRLGPLWGGLLGVIPQCGFSAAGANLYAGRVITLGTLFAIFLSTSDEMLPIMLSEQSALPVIGKLLVIKAVIAIIIGFALDAVLYLRYQYRKRKHLKIRAKNGKESDLVNPEEERMQIERLCEKEHCHCEEGSIFKSAFTHSLHIFLFILVISFVLNGAFALVGEEALTGWLGNRPIFGEMMAGLIGLIPNCGASVLLTQMYLKGIIGASQLIAGLLVGAGVGLLVLFRVNPNPKENIKITVLLYVTGVVCGLIVRALGIVI